VCFLLISHLDAYFILFIEFETFPRKPKENIPGDYADLVSCVSSWVRVSSLKQSFDFCRIKMIKTWYIYMEYLFFSWQINNMNGRFYHPEQISTNGRISKNFWHIRYTTSFVLIFTYTFTAWSDLIQRKKRKT